MLGQYIMLLVVPLTLADSNQHNLADSTDSTGFHRIMANSTRVHQIWPMSYSWSPAECVGQCKVLFDEA